MSGEAVSYRLNEPMDWATFKAMPDDVKKMYILALQKRFDVTGKMMAEMFGCSVTTYAVEIKRLNCKSGKPRGRCSKVDNESWNLWLAGQKVPEKEQIDEAPEEPEYEPEEGNTGEFEPFDCPEDEAEPTTEKAPMWEHVNPVPVSGTMTFQGNAGDIMQTVTGILGENTYARITITWETEADTVGRERILPANKTY